MYNFALSIFRLASCPGYCWSGCGGIETVVVVVVVVVIMVAVFVAYLMYLT